MTIKVIRFGKVSRIPSPTIFELLDGIKVRQHPEEAALKKRQTLPEPQLKLVYCKTRNGRPVDRVWRTE